MSPNITSRMDKDNLSDGIETLPGSHNTDNLSATHQFIKPLLNHVQFGMTIIVPLPDFSVSCARLIL